MASIDASRKDLVEEFRKTPVGHQSVELQKMMSVMRGERFPGKHVLICTKPFKEWRLAQLSGVRGDPPEVVEGVGKIDSPRIFALALANAPRPTNATGRVSSVSCS